MKRCSGKPIIKTVKMTPRLCKKGILFFAALFLLFTCSVDKQVKNTPDIDFCASVHKSDTLSLGRQLAPVAGLMQNKTGVYVLEQGDVAMMARAWLTEYAEKSIDIQYFIFSTDNVGLIAVDYLLRAAERGVKIRLLLDDLMVDADPDDILLLDAQKNISIRIYNPVANIGKNLPQKLFSLAAHFRGFNQRMHNKTFIVDKKVVITGGRNIADEYFDYDHEYNFRDRDVLLIGGVTSKVQDSFERFWSSPLARPVSHLVDPADFKIDTVRGYAWLHQYACNPDNFWPQVRSKITDIPNAFKKIRASGALQWVDSIRYVSDDPGKNDGSQGLSGGGKTLDALVSLVRRAKKSIRIQSPYLITTPFSRKLFRDAVNRGVTVTILTNSLASTDNLEAFNGYHRDRDKLLRTGVRIYEFRPDAAARYAVMTGALQKKLNYAPVFGLHAKSMAIDDTIAVIGTYNLDPRSANLNTECITIIYSPRIAANLQNIMDNEIRPENAWEVTIGENPDIHAGWWKRFKAWTRWFVPKSIL